MDEEGALPDHLRCKRTDGRKWRCNRRVMEDKKLCEVHHLQGRHRQHKERVPDSLKLQRKNSKQRKQEEPEDQNGEIRVRKREKEKDCNPKPKKISREIGASEALDKALLKMKLKKGDLQLELIRGFLKREVEKKKERELRNNSESEKEVTKVLPYGVMAISGASSQQNLNNDNAACNVKIGVESSSIPRRLFRSKNIEPIPISTMQVVPFAQNVAKLRKAKRKKCHWCRKSSYRTLIKCLSCKKEVFCMDCINERSDVVQEQVKIACPVCCGMCSCKTCLKNKSKDGKHKDRFMDKKTVEKKQQLHYLLYMLLPVLEQINREQRIELELEAKIKGKKLSEVQIQQAELNCNKILCCNNCRTSVVDFHRRCRNCSYSLCLSCLESFRGSLREARKAFISKFSKRSKVRISGDKLPSKTKPTKTSRHDIGHKTVAFPSVSPKWRACNENGSINCPPVAFGGCGHHLLDLRCVYPFSRTEELKVTVEQIVRSYDHPDTSDAPPFCSICRGMDDRTSESKLLQLAASREESDDNFLYYPTSQDLRAENLEHFQKHWGKGHPVIIRRVLKNKPDLSWDPVVMFCSYLEKSSNRSQNDKEATKAMNCLDWCEIEICSKQIFMGSLEGRSHANMWNETLKLKAWLSSKLFQEQLPVHHAEITRALPLQEYMNPVSGLLNLAANLPQGTARPDLGPCMHISFGSPKDLMQADFLTKLCYDSHDVVNILVHTSDTPISTEHLSKIKNLMKKHNSHGHKEPTGIITGKRTENEVEEKSAVLSDNTEELGSQDIVEEGLPLPNAVPLFTSVSYKGCSSSANDVNMPHAEVHISDSDSEASILCSGAIQSSEESEYQKIFQQRTKSSNCPRKKPAADPCGAQWDVFRQQDVPKLLEYLSRHSNEFRNTFSSPKHVVHPLLDRSFYLDTAHKMRLKEEFDIEPWTFKQNLGEAVIIPAGCPYQIKKLKSCVNIILDFISPENAGECIKVDEELRLLPLNHTARKNMLEVKKMTLSSIRKAVEEICNQKGADVQKL